MFSEVLGIKPHDLPLSANFFAYGGDSFRAGRAVAALRREFNHSIDFQIGALYQHKTAHAMAKFVRAHLSSLPSGDAEKKNGGTGFGATSQGRPHTDFRPMREPCSPASTLALFVQALPGFVLMPFYRVVTWVLFLWCLVSIRAWFDTGSNFYLGVLQLLVAGIISNILRQLIAPWLGILLKCVALWAAQSLPFFPPYFPSCLCFPLLPRFLFRRGRSSQHSLNNSTDWACLHALLTITLSALRVIMRPYYPD